MSGVSGVSARMRRLLAGDARQWIGADVSVSVAEPLNDEEQQLVAELGRDGVRSTVVVDTHAMIVSDSVPQAVPATLKVVDPATYPLYGRFQLAPSGTLSELLRDGWVVVSPDLPTRLNVGIGDSIRLNQMQLRIAAVAVSEPDRFAGYPSPMLRVLLTPRDYERSGLGRLGTTHRYQIRFRSSPTVDVEKLRNRLDPLFSYADVTDYRDPDPPAIQSFETTITFLGLMAWMALVFGAAGVGLTAYLHIRDRMPAVAAMKCLGGTARQVAAIYTAQVAGIGMTGALAGTLFGRAIEGAMAGVAVRYLGLPIGEAVGGSLPLLQIGIGVLSALATAGGPLWMVRQTPPLAILRRDYQPAAPPAMLALGVPAIGFGSLALWLVNSANYALLFLAAIATGALLLWLTVRLGLGAAANAVGWISRKLCPDPGGWSRPIGHGARNLRRPETRAPQMGLVIAAGILIMTAGWMGQSALTEHIVASLPGHGADFFVLGTTEETLVPMKRLVDSHPAAAAPMEILPLVWMRLSKVNGHAIAPGAQRMWFASCLDQPPPERVEGHWLRPNHSPAEVVLSAITASAMHAAVGSTLEFQVRGGAVHASVVGIRQLDRVMDAGYAITFSCDVFRGLRPIYHGAVHARPGQQPSLLGDLLRDFPAATILRREEFRVMLHAVAGRAVAMLRLLSILVLAAGVLLLAILVGATRTYRAREIAMQKMLGAGGRWLTLSLAGEFGTLGAASGFAGGVLGCGLASLLVSFLLAKTILVFSMPVIAVATTGNALLSIGAGWLSTASMRSRRPLPILREE